jgi:hypothetical protein
VAYVDMVRDPTGSVNQWLSDKIITVYVSVWLVMQEVGCIVTVYVCMYAVSAAAIP